MVATRPRRPRCVRRSRRAAALTALVWFAVATAAPAAPTTLVALQVPELARAQTIQIDDAWTGLTRAAPIQARYLLERAGAGFRGHADFYAGGGYPGGPRHASAEIAIPQAAVAAFFDALAQTPLRPGPYTPARGHTDDYPDLTLTITAGGKEVVFASRSQGKDRNPWQVRIQSREYVSASGQPAAALELLAPHLKRDVLDALVASLGH